MNLLKRLFQKEKKTAWLLDEDVLLEGKVSRNCFFSNTKLCGFGLQYFDKEDIDSILFFDLQKAIDVCGDIPVIKDDKDILHQ